MAVVPLVEKEDATPEVRAAYEDIEENFGAELNAFKALAHKPSSVEPVWQLHKILLMEGVLDPELRQLAILKINALNSAEY